jgi:hypothetical protein
LLHNIEAIVFIAGTTKDECSKDGKRPIGGEHVEIPLRFLNVFPNRSGCPKRRPKLIAHLRDIEVDWVEETPTGKLSKRLPATGIVFRETTTDYENSWHL